MQRTMGGSQAGGVWGLLKAQARWDGASWHRYAKANPHSLKSSSQQAAARGPHWEWHSPQFQLGELSQAGNVVQFVL